MNLNKVFLIGRLTQDPQLRTTPSGQSVTTLSVATNRVWTNKSGGRQEDTEFHNVVVWGRQAEIASQFLKKGSMLFVEGRLQTRTWQDAQGQTRKSTEVVSERIQLGPRAFQPSSQFNQSSPVKREGIDEDRNESLPDIHIGEDEIKAEDLPF